MEEKQSLMNSRKDINKEGTLMDHHYFLLIVNWIFQESIETNFEIEQMAGLFAELSSDSFDMLVRSLVHLF